MGQILDFFARRKHFVRHMAPIWEKIEPQYRGKFYVLDGLQEYAKQLGVETEIVAAPDGKIMMAAPFGSNPIVTSSYKDMELALRKKMRPPILMEHGIGLTPSTHPGYAGGVGGYRDKVDLFLVPNQHTYDKNARVYPRAQQVIVGVPKMDKWMGWKNPGPLSTGPVVAIAFHWDGTNISPEAGNAFEHYKKVLPELAMNPNYHLIGHYHPRSESFFRPIFEELGIEVVPEFDDVMERADLYINDCSSTLYEFLVTGKPVIILNDPKYRRELRGNIRFWQYTDVGIQVEEPWGLPPVIDYTLSRPEANKDQREKAVADLFPNLGYAAETAAFALEQYANNFIPVAQRRAMPVRKITSLKGDSIGIIYMGFGKKAAEAIAASRNSMIRLGMDIPVAVVGDAKVMGTKLIPWTGEDPFDPDERHNFQFRAGRIKPYLYELSPFDRTLYIDADTEFMNKIFLTGFEYLTYFEMAVAQEMLTIGKLYNKPRAGWEINIKERDYTIEQLGRGPDVPFLNSGVIFFRKSDAVAAFMRAWGEEWKVFKQWDEQLSLMRAMAKNPVKLKTLSVQWNCPHRAQARIIFHNYGRGVVRMDSPLSRVKEKA